MSRKHFVAAAQQVKILGNTAGRDAAKMVADEFADLFAQFNSNFDRSRFMSACGL
jgi:hypothetical protein